MHRKTKAPIHPEDSFARARPSAELQRILQNLIDNAIKFTANGQVTVAVRDIPDKGQVEFKIRDSHRPVTLASAWPGT